LCYLLSLATPAAAQVTVTLADQPIFASTDVPGNLALALSVEYPTAISVANLNDYSDGSTYLGYFDPNKCYTYQYDSTTADDTNTASNSYFQATAKASGSNNHSCSGAWSGNFMNWATMQTIDPFRWALTGGYRVVDTQTMTVLEKAWGAAEGNTSNFPYRGTSQSTGNNLTGSLVSSVTPFGNWSQHFDSAIWSNGNMLVFSNTSAYKTLASNSAVKDLSNLNNANKNSNTSAYRVLVRVRVCDKTVLGISGLESNCVGYGTSSVTNGVTTYSIYKPEGLMQQYSKKIRFAALSYLNDSGLTRQGGVLREPMGYIGPTYPQPLTANLVGNARSEWDATTGIMNSNPDTATATASGVSQSGVMNFLNKFGEYGHRYMTYDNVSELYYAAVRYYENLGNVTEWSNNTTATTLDGFPAVTTWADPIAYRCQKNFILGIGDNHTWYDYNVGGGTYSPSGSSRPKPSAVSSDTFNQAHTWTHNLQTLENLTNSMTVQDRWPQDTDTTYYMAGLAYGVHVLDIRNDMDGPQNISTYWMDVMEYQRAEDLNPYYLAAKYGGFTVPKNYDITQTSTALNQGWWDTSNQTINMNGHTRDLPDNYFPAGNAGTMVRSLKAAFTSIANAIKAYTTSFSLASPIVGAGEISFSSSYDSTTWTSTVTGSNLTFDASGNPSVTSSWVSSTTLENQLAGTGWQSNRRVVTLRGSTGVPFETGSISSTQLGALLPANCPSSIGASNCEAQYLGYIRGDRTYEIGSSSTASSKYLRSRSLLLGDIVDASVVAVGKPAMSYSDAHNTGYSDFKKKFATRATLVYAAANDGMLHAFVGSTGVEQFAYVPAAVFQGPSGTPQVDGLVALGNPTFVHHFYVDATPGKFDLDLNRTGGNTAGNPDWETLLIGGLGKGGRSYYALKVTDPSLMTDEASVANDVMWEFTDPSMGYSYGAPIVVKTAKYGWIAAFTSGYDNSDGFGYVYIVNPANGTLLEKIRTPIPSSGLAQAAAYVQDYTDYTADSIYVGDLNGHLWRFDLTGTSGLYPAPTQIATLTDAGGNAQPVTTWPQIEIHPSTHLRYVLVGTGKLLSTQDIGTTTQQSTYAIIDGGIGAFSTIASPITRANLTQVTDLTMGATVASTAKGWYYDFTATGERVVYNQTITRYYGQVAFATFIPSTDPCSPSGASNGYAIDFSIGKSTVLNTLNNSTTPAAYMHFGSAVTSMSYVSTSAGLELIAGQTSGDVAKVPTSPLAVNATRLLNWTELPTAE